MKSLRNCCYHFLSFVTIVIVLPSCVNDNLVSLEAKVKANDTTAVASSSSSSSTANTPPSTTPVVTTPVTTIPASNQVSFSNDIRPILVKYSCAGCHESSFNTFSGVSSLAKSGQLYGTMSWANGYRRMPPGQKATTAELTLISTWITQGTLNN